MWHVPDRQCGAFTVLVLHTVVFLVLIHSCSGQSEPIGPSQPIVAIVGDDIILPCQLVPVMNAFVMTVEWARRDLDPRFVLLWRDGEELASKKHPSYRGRTSLSTDRLEHGDVSLKLSSVRISDEGRYRCFIPDLKKSPTVQLVVGAVSSPQILMTETSGGDVLLQCDAKGWYPEPEVVWLDGEGDHVPAGPAETLRGPDDLYSVSSSLTVEKRGGNFTCRVQQKTINRTRETHVQVADHSFMVASPHVLIGSIIGCAALVFIPAVLFVVWKRTQKKLKFKRKSPEDGPEQTEEGKEVTSNRDNTGVQVGEGVSLLAGREEEKNEIELIQSETNRDQLVTKPDEHRAEEESEINSISSEKVPLIATEGETHQMQDMIGRQIKLPLVLVEDGHKEQQLNVHAAQEVRKEEETNQVPMNNVDEKDAKKKDKKERVKKVDSVLEQKKLQENRKEQRQSQVERRRWQMPERKEMEEDNVELKPREGKEHLLGDRKQEGRKEHEDAKVEDQKGKHSNITRMKEGNQKVKLRETKEENDENERTLQSELKTQEIVAIKDQEGNQSEITRTTERYAETQKETLKETKEGRDDNVKESEEQGNIQMLKDSVELKPQEGKEHLLGDQKQEGSNADHEDTKVEDQEGNQSNITRMKEGNQKIKLKETEEVKDENVKESEEQKNIQMDKEKIDFKTKEEDTSKQDAQHEDEKGNQSEITRTTERCAENQKETLKETKEGRDDNVKESEEQGNIQMVEEMIDLKTEEGDTFKQEAEHEDEKGNQSNINAMTESRKVQINEKSKESEMERGERETPSVSREVTARPYPEVHQEATTGRQNLEEKELQPEKQQEETKEQPEKSTKGVKVQRLNVEKEIREQPELLKPLAVMVLQHQEASQAEPMEIDSSPRTQRDVSRGGNRKQREQENELHVNRQQTAMKRRRREEGAAKTRETFKKLKEHLGKEERLGKQELKELLGEKELKELLGEKELKELLVEKELKELLGEKKLKELLGEKKLKELLGEQSGDPMEFKEGANTDKQDEPMEL